MVHKDAPGLSVQALLQGIGGSMQETLEIIVSFGTVVMFVLGVALCLASFRRGR
jgi:hypothetical protein